MRAPPWKTEAAAWLAFGAVAIAASVGAGLYVGAHDRTRVPFATVARGASVLFVGNSYTYVNDLPARVHEIAAALGTPLEVQTVAMGGATLRNHLESPRVASALREGHFAYVVVQGQSAEPLTQPEAFASAAGELAAQARAAGAVPILFETWARAPGSAEYKEAWSRGNALAMQAGLREGYRDAARLAGARVAPVGDALERAEARHGRLAYFLSDGSHPSMVTTFLAASVLYEALTGHPAIGAPAPPGVSDDDARFAEAVAHDTVQLTPAP